MEKARRRPHLTPMTSAKKAVRRPSGASFFASDSSFQMPADAAAIVGRPGAAAGAGRELSTPSPSPDQAIGGNQRSRQNRRPRGDQTEGNHVASGCPSMPHACMSSGCTEADISPALPGDSVAEIRQMAGPAKANRLMSRR